MSSRGGGASAGARRSVGANVREFARTGELPFDHGLYKTSRNGRNRVKTRVGQSAFFLTVIGAVLLIISISSDAQYGWSARFTKPHAGAPLLAMEYIVSFFTLVRSCGP